MFKKISIWRFDNEGHYIIKVQIGKSSYGWRVNVPYYLDGEYEKRVDRLIKLVEKMERNREENDV